MSEAVDRAFNQGCDARLRGDPCVSPYPQMMTDIYRAWRRGWLDVNKFWGVDSQVPVMELPKVRRVG